VGGDPGYRSASTIITGQCPINDWHPDIGDPAPAEAICDRSLHNTFKIDLRGDPMRKGKKESEPIPKEKQGKGNQQTWLNPRPWR